MEENVDTPWEHSREDGVFSLILPLLPSHVSLSEVFRIESEGKEKKQVSRRTVV